MSTNPLFPAPTADDQSSANYLLPKNSSPIEPLHDRERNAATEVIRHKLDKIYADEPDAIQELTEVQEEAAEVKPLSKHQLYMQQLGASGKSLAEIQTEWHHYYTTLPEEEKHEVWQEFYASNATGSQYHAQAPKPQPAQISPAEQSVPSVATQASVSKPKVVAVHPEPRSKPHSRAAIKRKLVSKVSANGKLKAKHHLQSLVFGLSMGAIVIFIVLFSFFNEVLIAPFIQPSRHANATPLILSTDGVAPTANPEVIIPKINVELPVDFSQTSTDESTIEDALESGVVHYPTTVLPGQNGNTAYFGHSSNNIFNKGKYKFAFVLLHQLIPGDTFYITYNSKVYVYKVISKDIVPPTDIGVLGPVANQKATATLITCDPPGTSLNRLIVVGQQITPDPSTNTEGNAQATRSRDTSPAALPGNGPTLFRRLWNAIF